jgi:hypothetical protein
MVQSSEGRPAFPYKPTFLLTYSRLHLSGFVGGQHIAGTSAGHPGTVGLRWRIRFPLS